MNDEEKNKKLCKIVYFDESSITDYIQIVKGGTMEITTKLLEESSKKISGDASAKAGTGLSGILKALMGFEVSASLEGEAHADFGTSKMASNILKNTVLTDFMNIINPTVSEASTGAIKKFAGYKISAPENSFSYVALISPYLSMLKGGSNIPAGEFNLSIDKLDSTIKSAKGYYEFIGTSENKTVIFRFNINSFNNNYKASDLLRMDIAIFAIKVGKSTIAKLDIDSEFNIGTKVVDNPSYDKTINLDDESSTPTDIEYDVFDVLLAGVENYD